MMGNPKSISIEEMCKFIAENPLPRVVSHNLFIDAQWEHIPLAQSVAQSISNEEQMIEFRSFIFISYDHFDNSLLHRQNWFEGDSRRFLLASTILPLDKFRRNAKECLAHQYHAEVEEDGLFRISEEFPEDYPNIKERVNELLDYAIRDYRSAESYTCGGIVDEYFDIEAWRNRDLKKKVNKLEKLHNKLDKGFQRF